MQTLRTDVARAARATGRLARIFERAIGDLSLAHYRVLSSIAAGDERASWIAGRYALGKPAVSASVESLTQAGLIEGTTVDGDNRATTLLLTADGKKALRRAEDSMTEHLKQIVARTPDPEQVLQSLIWIDEALDAHLREKRLEHKRNEAKP